MNLKDIMLSELRERQILYVIIYVWNLKNKQKYMTKQKQTQIQRINWLLVVGRGVWGQGGVKDEETQTTMYKGSMC